MLEHAYKEMEDPAQFKTKMEDALTKFPTDEDLQDCWTKMEDALTKFPMDEDLQD